MAFIEVVYYYYKIVLLTYMLHITLMPMSVSSMHVSDKLKIQNNHGKYFCLCTRVNFVHT